MSKGLSFAAAALVAFTMLAVPSLATDGRGAIKGCDTNPNCRYDVNDDGSVDLDVIQADGSYNWVHCPPKGECICKACRTKGGNLTGVAGATKYLNSLGMQ